MTTEKFSKQEFEDALFNIYYGFVSVGLEKGEETYLVGVNSNARLKIRSSVDANGFAADTSKDSIRLWLEVHQPSNNLEKGFKWRSTSKKVDAYTTRVSGWEKRLEKKIKLLWDRAVKFRQPVERCPKCDNAMRAGWSQSEKNPERPFATCNEKYNGCGLFKWLDKPLKKGDKVEFDSISAHTQNPVCTQNPIRTEQSTLMQVEYPFPLQENRDEKGYQPKETGMERSRQGGNQQEPSRSLQALPEKSQEDWSDLETLFNDPPPKEKKTPNPKQLEAITSPINANIRVLAPPGSGKTFIIEHRYQHLIENGIDPDNILVVTFNKNMATEMMDRILSTCPSANTQQISTIHAFCFRVLTKWNEGSPYFGWQSPGRQSSMKQWEVRKLLDDIISDVWIWGDKPGHKEVLNIIDTAKYHGVSIEDSSSWLIKRLGATWGEWLYQIRKRFDNGMSQRKQMTYADMLFLMEQRLLGNEQFKVQCQKKFPYVMIDEGQDVNYQAMRIFLDHIATYSFIVGDVDQMMYRFQGAKPELITSKYASEIETILLDTNYRSTGNIIQGCQNLISQNYSDQDGPYSQEFMKDTTGIKDEGKPISFEMYPSVEAEGKAVSETISELIQQGYESQDFFVGARTRAQLGYLEGQLFRAGIKFINIAGGSFWQSKHVADVVSYLKLAHNPKDFEALKRIRNIPSNNHVYTWNDKRGKFQAGEYCSTRYLGPEFLKAIRYDLSSLTLNNIDDLLYDSWRYKTKAKDMHIFGPSKAQDLIVFVEYLQESLDQADNMGQVIRMIIDDCYQKYLQSTEGFSGGDEAENGKLEDLRTVEDIASEYELPEDFLKHVTEMEKATEDAKNGDWEDYVILSTYHKLKGLERPVVLGTGWCEGSSIKTGEPRGLLPHTFSLVEPPQFGVLPSSGQSPIEDERCIAFVCISRAKELVYLSGCETYRDWVLGPSRFIKELELWG